MGSLSKFVTGLSIAVIAGMAVNMGVVVAEPPPTVRATAVVVGATVERVVADEIDGDALDPAAFLADLFGDHFGVRYVPGSSGLSTTVAGATVDGQEIPVELIGDYEASGYEVLRRWNVQIVSGGGVVGQAGFTETARIALPGLTQSPVDLQAQGFASSTRVVVSGFTRNARGEERELFGLVAEMRTLDGTVVSAFSPVGGEEDPAAAAMAAQRLAEGFVPRPNVVPELQPNPVPVPPGPGGPGGGEEDFRQVCRERYETCMQVAWDRYQACRLQALGVTAACMAGCAAGCIASGPLYPGCIAACGAACIGAEVAMLLACNRNYDADVRLCEQAQRDCIRNRGR